MTENPVAPRIFVVWWKDLERWVIPTSLLLRHALPPGWQRARVGEVVRQVSMRVKAEAEKEYKMAGVKWYGEGVFHRETVRGDGMSANQVTPLVAGALIYNRLFAWKASFAVVPPELADCYVSSEFPQFMADPSRILSEYLYLFCTRSATIRAVNSASTGSAAVSRNRFKEEQFLGFEIALPPLVEQKAIVARWRDAQDKISAMRQKIEHLEANLQKNTRKALGIPEKNEVTLSKAFAIQWAELARWSFEYLARQVAGLGGNDTGKYPTHSLLSLCSGISGGTPSTKSPHYWEGNIPWVSPKDMKSAEIYDSQDHISQTALEEAVPLVPANSVLIVVRSGILQRVVPIAVNCVPVSINQDLRAFVPRDGRVSADFLAAYLNCQQDALLRLVKWSTTVQSINKEELDSFEIPLPSTDEQKQIVQRVKAGRAEIAHEQDAAERLSKEITADIEALILGSKILSEQ